MSPDYIVFRDAGYEMNNQVRRWASLVHDYVEADQVRRWAVLVRAYRVPYVDAEQVGRWELLTRAYRARRVLR